MAVEKKYNIQEILNTPKSLADLSKALGFQMHQRLHTTGEGYDSWWMKRNIYLESQRSYEIKKIVCAQTTPRIVEGIKKQFYKIFRAKGRVINYNLDSTNSKIFEEKLKDVNNGMSMDDVMQVLWHDGMFEDHHAIIGVELKPQEELTGTDPEPFVVVYPTQTIHDICIKGSEIEYVVLKTEVLKEGQVVGTIGLFGLTIVILKLTGLIHWPWWLTTMPFWIVLVSAALLFLVIAVVIFLRPNKP